MYIITQEELLNNQELVFESDYILLDEAQRMCFGLWELLTNNMNKKYIFSLDPKQVLTKEEIKANYNNLIDKIGAVKYKLSNRIRINNSIKDFTYRLFDRARKKTPLDLSYVNIHFASTSAELERYFEIYAKEYTYITIPNTNYSCKNINKVDISDVVGKDYENVLMVLDHNYFYSNMKLSSHNSKNNDYLYLKILYQGLSRTRENVTLIIYKNKKLFKDVLENIK